MTGPQIDPSGALPDRVEAWRRERNYVAVGNLGEQITARLLLSLGYQLLGGQDDFLGMVSDVLGEVTQDKPEDMIAVDPVGRLVTVNTKAALSVRSCRVKRDRSLGRPHMDTKQRTAAYSTRRASLVSPLSGDSFAQVVKVDLRHRLAQIFEIDEDRHLQATSQVLDIADILTAVLTQYPQNMPPPNVWELDD